MNDQKRDDLLKILHEIRAHLEHRSDQIHLPTVHRSVEEFMQILNKAEVRPSKTLREMITRLAAATHQENKWAFTPRSTTTAYELEYQHSRDERGNMLLRMWSPGRSYPQEGPFLQIGHTDVVTINREVRSAHSFFPIDGSRMVSAPIPGLYTEIQESTLLDVLRAQTPAAVALRAFIQAFDANGGRVLNKHRGDFAALGGMNRALDGTGYSSTQLYRGPMRQYVDSGNVLMGLQQ
jgi:hypothetical protein